MIHVGNKVTVGTSFGSSVCSRSHGSQSQSDPDFADFCTGFAHH